MKAGETFIVTSGEYSDYGIRDHLRALVDFSWNEEAQDFVSAHPDPYDGGGHQDFLEHLRAKRLVEEVPLKAIHIGDYSRLDLYAEGDST